ncbi:MAG: glycine cleavage system protein GcvH [Rhodospirillales bacterium]|jgi:glycine cleavage system H protein|nr:glycine cleavage system protein GcvH [Rhodospirillales bacterium]MBT5076373.1 glycine cleavage system protein GcvH [Rhodospirillales bacterium]MBT5113933.1 glycine cleavage system protein GcvH [Rhodospirillales bacterium]MBT5672461.1 glycine cleavage system protein GcvH [Rhodospirillales bacterium]MBT6185870.1 glycine cleavage system protein GcvH [Rhodospirillales bacterium]
MAEKRFTNEHEWIEVEDGIATVGISVYAQEQLGDVVYVELPDVGKAFVAGDQMAVVESVKAASEVYAPVDGTVAEVNDALNATPEKVNEDGEGDGWFVKLSGVDAGAISGLMDPAAYKAYLEGID